MSPELLVGAAVVVVNIASVFFANKNSKDHNKRLIDGSKVEFEKTVSTQIAVIKESYIDWQKLENHRKEDKESIKHIHGRIDSTNDDVRILAKEINGGIGNLKESIGNLKESVGRIEGCVIGLKVKE